MKKEEQQQPAAMGIPVGLPPTAPPMQPQNQQVPSVGGFSTGLCDCFSDVELCCMTCWCPCITFGRIAEIVDKGSSSCGLSGAMYSLVSFVIGCPSIYSCTYRQKMRDQYGMPGNCFGDFCTHCWCEQCALCQEYRELQHRGYDVALGWHGNMERQAMAVAPPMHGGMTRY